MQSKEVIQQSAHRPIWNQSKPQSKRSDFLCLVMNQQVQLAVQPANPRAKSDNTTSSHIGATNSSLVLATPIAPLATVAPFALGAPLTTVSLALLAPPAPQQTSGQLQQFQPTGQARHLQVQPNDQSYVESDENSLTSSDIPETTKSAITAKTIKNDPAIIAAYAAAYRDAIALFCQVKVKDSLWRLILQQPLPDWVHKGEG
ncbi:hypothetical protein MMC29_005064 [Sticta canariensis]|nr:hypothetical protein [Sticta canariensis]